jgi:hypothetical protein
LQISIFNVLILILITFNILIKKGRFAMLGKVSSVGSSAVSFGGVKVRNGDILNYGEKKFILLVDYLKRELPGTQASEITKNTYVHDSSYISAPIEFSGKLREGIDKVISKALNDAGIACEIVETQFDELANSESTKTAVVTTKNGLRDLGLA